MKKLICKVIATFRKKDGLYDKLECGHERRWTSECPAARRACSKCGK